MCSSSNEFVFRAGGLEGSNLRLVKLNKVFSMACHRREISSNETVLPARSDPQTRYTLRRNTASIMKDLI